jgi:hypothetical protein
LFLAFIAVVENKTPRSDGAWKPTMLTRDDRSAVARPGYPWEFRTLTLVKGIHRRR